MREFASYEGMDASVKNALRVSLLEEQGHLCAYCMSRIEFEHQGVKIDHYKPRSKYPELQLEYENLLAVCDGREGEKRSRQTCDTRKGDESELVINPLSPLITKQLNYGNDGSIKSDDPCVRHDINDILNLNDPSGFLITNRKSVLDRFKKEFDDVVNKRKKYTAETYLKRVRGTLLKPRQGVLDPYIGIVVWYVDKKLGQYNLNTRE